MTVKYRRSKVCKERELILKFRRSETWSPISFIF